MNDGETSSRRHEFGRLPVIKKKGSRILSRLVKENRRQTVDQLTAQFNAGPSRIVSDHTIQRTLWDVGLHSRRPTFVTLLTKRHHKQHIYPWINVTGQWISGREFPVVTHHVDSLSRICRLPCERWFPQCRVCHSQTGSSDIILWRTLSRASLKPVVVVEQNIKSAEYLNIIADHFHPYKASVFPTGNGVLHQDNVSCHKTRYVLEWFQEDGAELHLMSSAPNSPDLNKIEHIWDVI